MSVTPRLTTVRAHVTPAVRRALAGLARSEMVTRLGAMNYGSRDCYWVWAYRQRHEPA
jgi:hypothetical protein